MVLISWASICLDVTKNLKLVVHRLLFFACCQHDIFPKVQVYGVIKWSLNYLLLTSIYHVYNFRIVGK